MLRGIRLIGWMGLADVDLAIGKPFLLVMGPNGSGKTAVREAITWALTGRCRGVAAKKNLPAIVIRDGEERCTVGLMLGAGLYVERSLTRGGQESLRLVAFEGGGEKRQLDGTLGELQAELYARLGLDAGRAEAALDSWAFLGLDEESRTALLFRAFLGTATAEEIEKRLGEHAGQGPDVRRLAGIAAARGFRAAEKAAVDLRQQRHRELHALPEPKQAPRKIMVGKEERDLESVALDAFEGLLATNRTDRDRMLRESGAGLGAARARVEALEAREAALAIDAELPLVDPEPLRMRITQAHERAQAARMAAGVERERLAELDLEISTARAIADAATGEIAHPGTCPVVPGGFGCPATKSGLQVHARSLRKRAQDAAERIGAAERDREVCLSAIARADGERAEAEAEERLREGEHRAAEDAVRVRDRLDRDLAKVRADLAAAREDLAAAEAAGNGEQQVAFIDARIQSIEAVVAAKKAWEAYKADATKDRREELTHQHRAADALVKALEPDGVEADLLRDALVPIRERLAQTGRMLGEVTIGDDLGVRATVNGRPRLYEQLSRSQRLRLGIALQDAIASASGLPLLLVDELDVFQGPDRGAVLNVLRELVDAPYGSVIGFATATTPPTAPPGVAVYWLGEGGTLEAAA